MLCVVGYYPVVDLADQVLVCLVIGCTVTVWVMTSLAGLS